MGNVRITIRPSGVAERHSGKRESQKCPDDKDRMYAKLETQTEREGGHPEDDDLGGERGEGGRFGVGGEGKECRGG